MEGHSQGYRLQCRGLELDCSKHALVAGILNVTPDSFSDGGRFLDLGAALARAQSMVAEGARIIDVGGASSRPQGREYGEGAALIPAEVEMQRILPVIEGIADTCPETVISVDTFRKDVAQAAMEAGAHMINDITGLRFDPELADVVAAVQGALVVMHSIGEPGAMPHTYAYEDVTGEVCRALRLALHTARAAGVNNLAVDPGFGFGKTARQNLQLVAEMDQLCRFGVPVMVGISRKSTVGQVLAPEGVPVDARLYGTLGITGVAVLRGARLVRTHDVKPTVDLVRAIHATVGAL